MNSRNIKGCKNSPKLWRSARTFTALALISFLFTAGSVQADPVRVNQVIQTLSSYQGPAELKLSSPTQDPVSGQIKMGGPRGNNPVGDTAKVDVPTGLPQLQDAQKLGVEIIEEAEVEGTICDCGEIFVSGGGFPKWPLLFLTAVPLVFINDCEGCDEIPPSTPKPTPPPPQQTPTPAPVPEPASLLLFGTGLLAVGAGLRRRHAKSKKVEQVKVATEEE